MEQIVSQDDATKGSATATPVKHTPGPWKAHHGWAEDSMLSIDNESLLQEYPDWCEVTGAKASINGHFGIADARLIAASPELLEALRPLAAIADAFDDNGLDEARPEWGDTEESAGARQLFGGRGGRELLTLAHCFAARRAIATATLA